jgi:hypothetical protein
MKQLIHFLIFIFLIAGCKVPNEKQLDSEIAKDTVEATSETDSSEPMDTIKNETESLNSTETIADSEEEWKNKVLKYVQSSLDSLYTVKSVDTKVEILNDFVIFIEKHDNGKYYRIGSKSIFGEDWFYELGYLKLFPEVVKLDKVSPDFNGFEFLYKIKFIYNSLIEPSEVLNEKLSEIAYQSPDKFLTYIESIDEFEKRKRIVGTPYWPRDGYAEFLKAIEKSEFYKEIKQTIEEY